MDKNDFADYVVEQPITEGFWFERTEDGKVFTNVPHLVRHHSPTGYEWGHWGIGPADLALNILEAVIKKEGFDGEGKVELWMDSCSRLAWRLHQTFKFQFIGSIPWEGGKIPYGVVVDFIKTHIGEV